MGMSSVSSEEFSFPLPPSHFPGTDSPPLWKHSPENLHNRALARHDDKDQTKSFSYVERKSLWSDNKAEEKMDMLWEVLNEELLPTRSQSLRTDESSAVVVGCGLTLTKKTPPKKKKMSPNVLVLMRALKKFLVMRSSSRRSPAKTHPR